MSERFLNDRVELHCGDCREVLAALAENSLDACCTDPPYHLISIVKRFGAENAAPAKFGSDGRYARASAGFMGRKWDGGDIAFRPETWAAVYRVLKPGAHLIAMGGTRTYHRLACAIEDAGFEIRDTVSWLYGSGFPKSHDVSKGIDKQGAEAGAAIRDEIAQLIEASGKSDSDIAEVAGISSALVRFWRRRERNIMAPEAERLRELLFCSVPQEFERDVIGVNPTYREMQEDASAYNLNRNPNITAPATDAAREWEGWGTALKPSAELIVCARKPLTAVPLLDTLFETQILIAGALCPLLLNANTAENCFTSSLSVSGEACVSALIVAAVLHGEQSGAFNGAMDIFNSPATAAMFLNIASSWHAICIAVSNQPSTFTTSTETALITALRTLNSCILASIPASIIRAASLPLGELCGVPIVNENLNVSSPCWMLTPKHIARAIASLRQELNFASDATENFMVAAGIANSALKHALTVLPTTDAEKQFRPNADLIVLARKPLSEGTVAANCLRWGTGAINVDGCRVGTDGGTKAINHVKKEDGRLERWDEGYRGARNEIETIDNGRWPANVVHDGSDEVVAAFPETASGDLSKKSAMKGWGYKAVDEFQYTGDSGSAARYFYTAKADADDRLGSKHPTVKPLDLVQWLVRLVTPRAGVVLDPFSGTGTTAEAAWREGMRAVLIEAEPEYQADIRRRMKLCLAGPDERNRESIKAKNLPRDDGPLFGGIQEAAE